MTPRISYVPLWTLRIALTLLRRLTPLRTHQFVEFLLTVLTQEVVAPTTGYRHLVDHFSQVASPS